MIVGFAAADFVVPVRAGREVPASTGAEEVQYVALIQVGRHEQCLAGDAGIAVVIAQRQANLIRIAEAVAKIAGERAVKKTVVRSLTLGLEIGCRGGIVECTQQAADLAAAASGGETAAFSEESALRSARGAAVRENLNDACDRVGSIKRAFGAAHDFHLVNVVQREIGEIDGVPRFIHGSPVDEHLCVA